VEYRLVSLGRLKDNVDEQSAVALLHKITKLPEAAIKTKLLSGKRATLLTTTDLAKIEAVQARMTKAGLVVELIKLDPAKAEAAKKAKPDIKSGTKAQSKPKSKPNTKTKQSRTPILISVLVVLFLIVGAAGSGWYWLFGFSSKSFEAVENALLDDSLAGVAHLNVAQLNKLSWLAGAPIEDFLSSESDNPMLEWLSLRDQPGYIIEHALLGVYTPTENKEATQNLILTGDFSVEQWKVLMGQYFELQNTASNDIYLLSEKVVVSEFNCPGEKTIHNKPTYIKFTDSYIAVASTESTIQAFEQRLLQTEQASTNLARWQEYRSNKLASLMVLSPKDTASSLPGIAGMIGRQMASTVPNVTGLASSASVDLLNQTVVLNAKVFSDDEPWNTQTLQAANAWLSKTLNDPNSTSETLSMLLQPMRFSKVSDSVEVEWSLNKAMIASLKDTAENGLSSLMGGSVSSSADDDVIEIDESPFNYATTVSLSQLPDLKINEYSTPPLFAEGSFSADVNSLRMNFDDLLELAVEAKAALPKIEGLDNYGPLLRYQLHIDDVTDPNGQSLLRDERCVDSNSLFGQSKNHEPETQGSAFFDSARVTKRLRLIPKATATNINNIKGRFVLSAANKIVKATIPLRAGELVTVAGTTVELVKVESRAVRYKVTGEADLVLEVRALNKEGQVLKQDWSTASGRIKTQRYRGPVSAIEVFIADRFDDVSTPFSMTDIFVKKDDKEDALDPFLLSYRAVERARWNKYQFVDMRRLIIDSKDWSSPSGTDSSASPKTLGSKSWPGIKLAASYKPGGWVDAPTAHLYIPLLKELTSSLSALSYQVSGVGDKTKHFVRILFPYEVETQQPIASHTVGRENFGLLNFPLRAEYTENESFNNVNGVITLRLPQKIKTEKVTFENLWQEKNIDGVVVKLRSIDRGMLPGYQLTVSGELDKFVMIHGITDYNKKIAASSVTYQESGEWSMTIPFRANLNSVSVVLAQEQDVFELPFNF